MVDRFEPGDTVHFQDYGGLGLLGVSAAHAALHGPGPYRVDRADELPELAARAAGHPQEVIVDGVYYSGAWFTPIRISIGVTLR